MPGKVELDPPPPANSRLPGITTSLLYNGSRFRGHQKSKGHEYKVEVTLQNVDRDNACLCGYLTITGLTEQHPTITTFFEGEIISDTFPFLTRKWDADEEVDKKHWVRRLLMGCLSESTMTSPKGAAALLGFPDVSFALNQCQQLTQYESICNKAGATENKFLSFYPFSKTFNSDDFDYNQLEDTDFVFMRWKEHFLVPDHKVRDINGASFAGFYYICFQKSTSTIEGYYYHRSSEWYQTLKLYHVPEKSIGVYEFR